jgi:hypothetical protein
MAGSSPDFERHTSFVPQLLLQPGGKVKRGNLEPLLR